MAKVSLRTGQYRRLGRLSAKNPDKAERVAKRMVERRSRVARGSEFLKKNVDKLYPEVPTMKKGGKAAPKKAKNGASLKPVPADKQKSLGKLPTAVRNKMGFQKNGGKVKTAKGGAAVKKAPKKMMGGGKCKNGC